MDSFVYGIGVAVVGTLCILLLQLFFVLARDATNRLVCHYKGHDPVEEISIGEGIMSLVFTGSTDGATHRRCRRCRARLR